MCPAVMSGSIFITRRHVGHRVLRVMEKNLDKLYDYMVLFRLVSE